MHWNAALYNTHRQQVADDNLLNTYATSSSESMHEDIHPCTLWRRDEKENRCHTFGDLHRNTIMTPLPPPPLQAHGMVNVWQWRAVGNDHGNNKTHKKKKKQRSWQLEYIMMLGLLSRLSEWSTALAL
ncbi:hypothetical protein ATANTOWER_017678 [Ataeniobius toweri]|uniref:Uncharacterized protein n=1 Tax=Ataeniobius toweri TaxID=208326 RepID=A0ABU7BZV7_9TELE|nr:hypothetical protein [Ataeniobius toweri]